MNVRPELRAAWILVVTAIVFSAGAGNAEPQPVGNSNGIFAGTIDGNLVELPVHCVSLAGALLIDSHDQPISNSATFGGVEPAVNITGFAQGYQVVVFVGGERYKFLRSRDTMDSFPFSLAQKVRAGKLGKIEVDFTVDCPTP